MAQTAQARGRELALARRRALARSGKAGLGGAAASPQAQASVGTTGRAPATPNRVKPGASSARAASRARRAALATYGKAGVTNPERVRVSPSAKGAGAPQKADAPHGGEQHSSGCGCGCKRDGQAPAPEKTEQVSRAGKTRAVQVRAQRQNGAASGSSSRAAALARRKALSSRGKAGLATNGMSAAQTARAANPQMTGREIAQSVRAQRSRRGAVGQNGTAGRNRAQMRRQSGNGGQGAAQDTPWKVGHSETAHGQDLTGTMVGRSESVTGDEASTCRAVTGTEYMGAEVFREFCDSAPVAGARKVEVTSTTRGGRVSGSPLGRQTGVTGNEPGTCKRVTGTEYLGANQMEAFCGTKSERGRPAADRRVTGTGAGARREASQSSKGAGSAKVGLSQTLRGGGVSGTMVGRSALVTGDEPGSCRNVTGDEYVGQEHYSGCPATPAPQDEKVRLSRTLKGRAVSGTIPGRSNGVTGDEPGTCKAITGTPYAGAEQYRNYCKPEDSDTALARARRFRSTPGAAMTGSQPGIGGQATGDARGACADVSGTPYVGADQFGAACPATAAQPDEPDFPQPLSTQGGPGFGSQVQNAAQGPNGQGGPVTGSSYEQGRVTGPFGMAGDRVTGTEEFRFGPRERSGVAPRVRSAAQAAQNPEAVDRTSRITGEGMDLGARITGDDWDRGDRVTGTEGTPATGRNPTRRGGALNAPAAQPRAAKRNDDVPAPTSRVTGGSGGDTEGAAVTYSGGARG